MIVERPSLRGRAGDPRPFDLASLHRAVAASRGEVVHIEGACWACENHGANVMCLSLRGLAEVLDVPSRQLQRWSPLGLTVAQADELAGRAGLHPCEVWSSWWGCEAPAGLLEVPHDVEAARRAADALRHRQRRARARQGALAA